MIWKTYSDLKGLIIHYEILELLEKKAGIDFVLGPVWMSSLLTIQSEV